jgi:hypothetical protein
VYADTPYFDYTRIFHDGCRSGGRKSLVVEGGTTNRSSAREILTPKADIVIS